MDPCAVWRKRFDDWERRLRQEGAQVTSLYGDETPPEAVPVPRDEAVVCFVNLHPESEPCQQDLAAYAHQLFAKSGDPHFHFNRDKWESEKAKAEQKGAPPRRSEQG